VNRKNRIFIILFLALLTLSVFACYREWAIELKTGGTIIEFDQREWKILTNDFGFSDKCDGLDAEIAFYNKGLEVIEEILVTFSSGETSNFNWPEIAGETCITESGGLEIRSENYSSDQIEFFLYEYPDEIKHITDIAPSIAAALGISNHPFPGEALVNNVYDRVILIIWDAFGWDQYENAKIDGRIPNLVSMSSVIPAVTIFPSRTSTATAALITGLYPKENGVDRRGIRRTESPTIFDVLMDHDLASEVIEGESLPFNYPSTEFVLSGDRDQNNSTDDNVFINAMDRLEMKLPDFLFIHFHGVDDLGHQFGPDHQLVKEKISELDNYLLKIVDALPTKTLVILTADHGMHDVNENGRYGNHGNLIPKDMLMPIFLLKK